MSRSGYHDRTTGTWVEGSRVVEDLDMPLLRCADHGLYVA